ncbi:MAG TPA: type II toxin-antitoxin system RelE/ParE family toxin [Anaeromyxobacteraceae bacterium]|nr:type II toxin-antitoxin system RelE/ParE family toxin [Anaeromyxobacteraceae bacterium]
MKVELSDEARSAVARIDSWWRANRPSAPDLFLDELAQALVALEDTPGIGARYEPKPGVRRLLLRRTRYHLYFMEQPDRVFVVAVWSTSRGGGPQL